MTSVVILEAGASKHCMGGVAAPTRSESMGNIAFGSDGTHVMVPSIFVRAIFTETMIDV
jgi:hypothetical protein